MGTTIEDIAFEEHLNDLHESYIKSLEKLANSKNIKELNENLRSLKETKADIEKWMGNVEERNIESLSQALQEITTIGNIYKTLISESRKNKIYFFVGLLFAIVGILFSIF